MKTRILITGGAGFAGSHVVNHFLKNTDYEIVVLDRLNYASMGLDRLRDIDCFSEDRVKVFTADITKPIVDGLYQEIGPINYIIHMAAESHVDNSITDPEPFVMSNVVGTMHVLNFARRQKEEGNLNLFIYFSTDEVFGPAPEGVFYKENDRYNSGNPYAATKAGAEELCIAYENTYKIPLIVTHTMNIFGERQHPEKFIPKVMRAVMNDEIVYIHSNKEKTEAGKRHWIHGRNVAHALEFLLNIDPVHSGEKFNIVGEKEVDNLTMALTIAGIMGKELKYEMVDFHSSRPGHDLRYALDGTKMREMGWNIPVGFEESLKKTIEWTLARPEWLEIKK